MAKSKRANRTDDKGIRKQPNGKQGNSEDDREQTPEFRLDEWQEQVLKYDGNIALRAGRQVGKSTIISMKAAIYALNNPKTEIMIISATERQAYLLFSKVIIYLDTYYGKELIKKGRERPTKNQCKLRNGSIIRCLPTGLDGLGIRGYTINLLIADEAAFIPEAVWPAVIPMLATTGGNIILLSTPFGNKGFFYDRFHDATFKTWHINAEDIAENRLEPQRTRMKTHQEEQKKAMSQLAYAQEYLGEFISDFRRIFSDEVVKKSCIIRKGDIFLSKNTPYFLGVDIARLGDDSTTYQIVQKRENDLIHVYQEVQNKKLTTDTHDRIISLDKQWNFKQIGIDAGAGSLGVGIFDWLIKLPIIRQKIVAINNLQKSLDSRGDSKRRILKEDLYDNLLALMELGKIKLLCDEDLIESLRAIQYEYPRDEGRKTTIKIFASQHKFTDLVEGLIRAAWIANQKHLNSFISYM